MGGTATRARPTRRHAAGTTRPALAPMLAQGARSLPEGEGWTWEPKYDGIRVLAFATDRGTALVTRNGNDKARQFPDAASALTALARELGEPVVLDGEVVGVRGEEIVRFEALQGRMHVQEAQRIAALAEELPAALVAFDLLLAGDETLVGEPWHRRRARLEALLRGREGRLLRLGESSPDRDATIRRARRSGWEGVMAKRVDSVYEPGRRTGSWLKVKLEAEQEFVVGGWTEPRRSREHLGALLLGYYREGKLVYAGHTGTGFTRDTLREMGRRLRRLERRTSPFAETPATNEPAHWVTPKLVVQIRFNEWTERGVLRQPVFVGFRDDKEAREVVREPGMVLRDPPARRRRRGTAPAGDVARQIAEMAASGDAGTIEVEGSRLEVTHLGKRFFPEPPITKAELLRYYAEMAPLILPWMRDRPLVLRRHPDGIDGKAFYQQAAPGDLPEGVRAERVALGDDAEPRPRLVGGDLATLLYTVQLGAVSYDPWHSRVGRLDSADYTILDLDPGPDVPFRRVVEVARWVREEMDALGLHGALKTSGSTGLHVYLPLAAGTPLEAATLVAQIVATRVARQHPREATVERMVRKRPRGTVYVDYLQNILGKTVAGVYAVRAKPGATVSTPLRWDELTDDLDLRAFTVRTLPDRVRDEGDLWSPAMRRPNTLERMLEG